MNEYADLLLEILTSKLSDPECIRSANELFKFVSRTASVAIVHIEVWNGHTMESRKFAVFRLRSNRLTLGELVRDFAYEKADVNGFFWSREFKIEKPPRVSDFLKGMLMDSMRKELNDMPLTRTFFCSDDTIPGCNEYSNVGGR